MNPITDNDRELILSALDRQAQHWRVQCLENVADEMASKEYDSRANEIQIIANRMLENELVVFDLKPRCMRGVPNKDGENVQCKKLGRYSPRILVYVYGSPVPLADLAINPQIFVCEDHAVADIDVYLSDEQWREIQANTERSKPGTVAFKRDAKIIYMDIETKQLVSPPTSKIIQG